MTGLAGQRERATACKKGVHSGGVEAEPGADSDRVGFCEGWWL
jgi:hypothetical protein